MADIREVEPGAVHRWFGLTYANYLVLPRTLLQSMPDEWQTRFVCCLRELQQAFDHIEQAESYKVEPVREREVCELSDAELKQVGYSREDETYYDDNGNEVEPWNRVMWPTGHDPVPHYNRGRTYIAPVGDDGATAGSFAAGERPDGTAPKSGPASPQSDEPRLSGLSQRPERYEALTDAHRRSQRLIAVRGAGRPRNHHRGDQPMTAPAKKWRVYGARGISQDFRSLRAAYQDVQAVVASGVEAKVYHWEDGAWRLYERIQPPDVSPGR